MASAAASMHFDATSSRKRKREPEMVLEAPITIQPFSSSVDNRPRILTPLLALPRPWLPLSFLDVLSPDSTEPLTHLFSGEIEALENTSQIILIAKLELDRSYWTVERVESGIYALCRLKNLVKMKELRAIEARARKTPFGALDFPPVARGPGDGVVWWKMCKVNTSLPQFSSDDSCRPAIDTPTSTSLPDGFPNKSVDGPIEPVAPAITHIASMGETKTENSDINIQESLESIRTQYLEALYTSKASLAYFAKAPLSRARAVFNGPSDSPQCISHLIDFLQSLIMGLPLMDKKYRESLPECIRSISDGSLSDDELDISKPVKKAKKAKPKLGKSGLYKDEGIYISRWWKGRDEDNPMRGSVESELAGRVSSLRVRETELQMILILELLSLQECSKGMSQASSGEASKSKKSRPRVKDVDLCLDLLIDRLCIWQSVGSSQLVDGKAPDEKSQAKQADTTSLRAATDSVQNFWAGIIIPFYAPRLPGKCRILARKMAGSSSPSRSKTVTSKPSNRRDKPPPTKDSKPVKKLSLHRVLSNEKRAARSVHFTPTTTLQRPALAQRESSSQHAASSAAAAAAAAAQASRISLPLAHKLRQREVDLSVVPATAVGGKCTASVDSQLQGAITALRKPDRALVAGEIAQEGAERKARADRGKKSKRPQRHPPSAAASVALERNIQVKATPRKAPRPRPPSTTANARESGRTPSPPPATPNKRKHGLAEMPQTPRPPPPSSFAVLSSGVKARAVLAETPERSRQERWSVQMPASPPVLVPSSVAKPRAGPSLPLPLASWGVDDDELA